jgi:radical SAM superfamily enzyme YgiQ (UPF0313 family)
MYPDIKVVIGGAKSEAGKQLPYIDAVIHGYAEDKFLEYLNSLPNNKNRIKKSIFNIGTTHNNSYVEVRDDPVTKDFSIETLDHKFLPNDIILPNETLPLEISRGCIFKCSFCAFPLNGKSKLDYIRDSQRIKDELIYNYENYNGDSTDIKYNLDYCIQYNLVVNHFGFYEYYENHIYDPTHFVLKPGSLYDFASN